MSFERIEPGTSEWTAFLGNHQCRYAFAAQQLRGVRPLERTLDAATGVGYGAAHLAGSTSSRLVAIDRDAHALALAEKNFAHPRVTYLRDDCATLTQAETAGAPYDAAVSFETIEHLPDAPVFLKRMFALLRPGGVLIASTPNATVTGAERGSWEHHEREYTAPEFAALLADAGFGSIRLFGQRLTSIGALRRDVRAEIHRLRSNPVARLGAWLHQVVRGVAVVPPLPEQADDFTIAPLESAERCVDEGASGPFVLVAVATREPRA